MRMSLVNRVKMENEWQDKIFSKDIFAWTVEQYSVQSVFCTYKDFNK